MRRSLLTAFVTMMILSASLLAAAQEPRTTTAAPPPAAQSPCIPSIEFVRAIAWPVTALVIAFVFRRPLATFVRALGTRVTKLSLFKVELELVPATSATSTPLLDDIKTATTSAPISDSSRAMLKEVQSGAPADYATIDLGKGYEWLTSRLFIAAAMLERMRGLQVMVFLESTPQTARRFLAIAPVQVVRWSLAQQYPHLEAAWAGAYLQAFPTAAPLPTFTSTGAGNLVGRYAWRIVSLVGTKQKPTSVASATYTLTAATSGGHVDWTADTDEAVTGYEIYRTDGSGANFYLEGKVSGRFTTMFTVGGSGDTDTEIVKNRKLQEFSMPSVPQGAVWLPDTMISFQPMITSNTGAMDPSQAWQIVARFIDALQRPTTVPQKPDVTEPPETPTGWTRVGEREERAEFINAAFLRSILPQEAFTTACSDAFEDAPRAKRTRAVLRRISPFVALTRGDREFVRLVNRKALVEEVVAPFADEPGDGA
jgi:hypothetical protein